MIKSESPYLKKIKNILEQSTIHAIPNLVRNNEFKLIKFIWLVSFIISTCLCSFYVSKSLTDYFNFEVVSKTDIIYVDKLIFPIINICNLNVFTTNEAKNHISILEEKLEKDKSIDHGAPTEQSNIGIGYGFRIITNDKDQIFMNYSFDRKKLGLDLSEFLISCEFYFKNCNLTEDFEYFYDVNYGNCYSFNSEKILNGTKKPFKYVTNSGILNSFQLELFIGKASENDNFNSKENGFIIFINNQTLDSNSHEGIQISPGFTTRVILDKYSLTKVPYPYSECRGDLISQDSYDSDAFKKTISLTKNYRYIDCISICYQRHIFKECGCQSSLFNLFYNESVKKCYNLNKTAFECERNNAIDFYTPEKGFKTECQCPVECEKSGYSYSISYAEFPTREYYSKYLIANEVVKTKFSNQTNISYQDIRESVARVVIFYDELKETRITHDIKVQPIDLISNIGGLLGLFLGFSFLSMVEFLEIFLNIILYQFQPRSKIEISDQQNLN